MQMIIVSIIIVCTVLLFTLSKIRSDIVALISLVSLLLTNILTVEEALAGFANPIIFIIIAMFVVSESLVSSGIARKIGGLVLKLGKGSETRLIAIMMVVVVLAGAFMSSTAIVAIFIPITAIIAGQTGFNRRRLFMPLAVAALISGMTTLVATAPNLVVSNMMVSRGFGPMPFFSFAPFGAAALIVCMIFLLVFGRKMLAPKMSTLVKRKSRTISDIIHLYGLENNVHILGVTDSSLIVNLPTIRIPIREKFGLQLVAIEKGLRGKRFFVPVTPKTVFVKDNELLIVGDEEQVAKFAELYKLTRLPMKFKHVRHRRMLQQGVGVAEIILTPESDLVGKSLVQSDFGSRYQTNVLSLRRLGKPVVDQLRDINMEFGDTLLVNGSWDNILKLRKEQNNFVLLTLPDEYEEVAPTKSKSVLTLGLLGFMIITMATGLLETTLAAMLTALLLLLSGCVKMDRFYKVISWSSLTVIAAMMPLATALDKSGITQILSTHLVTALGELGPYAMLAAIFLLTTVFSFFLPSTTSAIIIAPIAIDTAIALNASPYAFAMTVAIACSASFATPISSPVNMLVLEAGSYEFKDFVKVGIPLVLLTMVSTVCFVGLVYLP